nr:immunoglobulin heavy chain junction region [Macaca mulatta]
CVKSLPGWTPLLHW